MHILIKSFLLVAVITAQAMAALTQSQGSASVTIAVPADMAEEIAEFLSQEYNVAEVTPIQYADTTSRYLDSNTGWQQTPEQSANQNTPETYNPNEGQQEQRLPRRQRRHNRSGQAQQQREGRPAYTVSRPHSDTSRGEGQRDSGSSSSSSSGGSNSRPPGQGDASGLTH